MNKKQLMLFCSIFSVIGGNAFAASREGSAQDDKNFYLACNGKWDVTVIDRKNKNGTYHENVKDVKISLAITGNKVHLSGNFAIPSPGPNMTVCKKTDVIEFDGQKCNESVAMGENSFPFRYTSFGEYNRILHTLTLNYQLKVTKVLSKESGVFETVYTNNQDGDFRCKKATLD